MSKPAGDPNADTETGAAETIEEEQYPMEFEESENNRKAESERENISDSVEKYDARKIATGEARYTADFSINFPDLLHAKVLRSDIAHGYVKNIDTSAAEEMDGVYAVITPGDDVVPDELYTSAGQSYPEPTPWDMCVLQTHVRYVGDPIAAVAAVDETTADKALRKMSVEYEEREPVLDYHEAMDPDAPQLFEPGDVENKQTGADYERNRESRIAGELGDVNATFEEAQRRDDWHIHETEWETPYQSHCIPEPHTTIGYRDEDNRYAFVTATQVPNHTRRQLSHLFDIPVRDIRVHKPRVGAGYGGKQAMILEPIVLALVLETDHPVKLEATRQEEFTAMRFRHPMSVTLRSVVSDDGELEAMDLYALSNTGAYGPHGMTVAGNVGTKPLPIYPRTENVKFVADIVNTNLPIAAALRGYGAPQGHFAVESHIDEVAHDLGMDPIEFRSINHVREGDLDAIAGILGGDAEGSKRRVRSCGMSECIARGKEAIGWDDLEQPEEDHRHRGVGIALNAQGSGVAGDNLGAAHIKMNEDGSFIMQVGGVDTGSGTDTMFTQIAAEVIGCDAESVVLQSSDTDITPFDYGSYASSTTYISGQAAKKAAEDALDSILYWAAKLLEEPKDDLEATDGVVRSTVTGEHVTLEAIGYESIYGGPENEQVMGEASHSTEESPSPFGAQFVDVTVDGETGEYELNKMVYAADCGVAINPALVEGQIEGGEHMSLELAVSGNLEFDEDGEPQTLGFRQYGMPRTTDHPDMETILVETHEPTGPFGAKSIAELPTNGVPPALSNAIYDAVGVRISTLPITAEKISAALED